MAEIGKINVNDLANQITVHVSITGHKKLWVKMYVGRQLIRIGIWIMGMNCEIETTD